MRESISRETKHRGHLHMLEGMSSSRRMCPSSLPDCQLQILHRWEKITAEEKAPSQTFGTWGTTPEHLLNQASVDKRLSYPSSPSKETVTNLYNAQDQVLISELDWLGKKSESNMTIWDDDNLYLALGGAPLPTLLTAPLGAPGGSKWTCSSSVALNMHSSIWVCKRVTKMCWTPV